MDIASPDHFVQTLSEQERTWLSTLLELTEDGPVALRAIWDTSWFTRASRRTLIIQVSNACAYLYLDHGEFLVAGRAERESAEALELAIFLEMLKARGTAFVFNPAPTARPDILYLGELFEKPHVEVVSGRRRITLNDAGDYTEEPEVIRDRSGRIAYSSICFGHDVFELLRTSTQGVLHIRARDRLHLLECLRAAHAISQSDDTSSSNAIGGDVANVAPNPFPADADADTTALREGSSGHHAPNVTAHRPRVTLFKRMRRAAKESIVHWVVVGVLSALHGAAAGWYAKDYLRPRQSPTTVTGLVQRRSAQTAPADGMHPPGVPASSAVGRVALVGSVASAPTAASANLIHDSSAPGLFGSLEVAPAISALPASEIPLARRSDVMVARPHGVDVSKWSGSGKTGAEEVFNFLPNLDFAFARVAYGTDVDPEFETNWRVMGRRQMYRGAYLFLRLDQDPVRQVDAAIAAIRHTSRKDLCLAIDFEELSFPEVSPSPPLETVQNAVSTALKHAASRLRCKPMLYTNPDVGDKYLNSPDFATYPLWVADWSKSAAPKLPAAWSSFSFWQRADHVAASPEPADLDIFNGELSDLARLIMPFRPSPVVSAD